MAQPIHSDSDFEAFDKKSSVASTILAGTLDTADIRTAHTQERERISNTVVGLNELQLFDSESPLDIDNIVGATFEQSSITGEVQQQPRLTDQPQNQPAVDSLRETTDRSINPRKDEVTTERTRLMHAVEAQITNPQEREKFKHNMEEFEQRAKGKKLSPEEVAKTYSEISRLLELKGDKPLSTNERVKLAALIVDHAAHPTTIDQGNHGTCNVTAIEAALYGKEPAVVAKVLTDVAATGKYTSPDGTSVWLTTQSLRPDAEASKAGQQPDARTYDTQLFNLVAVNLHYAKTQPNLHFEQSPVPLSKVPGDNGERIFDYSTTPPKLVKDAPNLPKSFEGMYNEDVAMVYTTLTGREQKDIVLGHIDYGADTNKGLTAIKDEADLLQRLTQLKQDNQYPIIVKVNTNNNPFWTDSGSGAAGGSGGGHVVTITDFQPGPPPKVAVDNQWGPSADHVSPNKLVSLHDMHLAMLPPDEAAKQLTADGLSSREHGQLNAYAELESIRLQSVDGNVGDPEHTVKIMTDAEQHWEKQKKDGTFNEREYQQAIKKFQEVYKSYSPLAKLEMLGVLTDNKMIMGRAQFNQEVARAGAQMLQEGHPYGTEVLQKLLANLPKDQRVSIEAQIRTYRKQSTPKH
ncbi:MAG: hypothetical protein HY711_11720 [Candidatus Melainabacteria bacterium]|nr:hypothetical protein [Candidatus Melainabacteria bacterium]